MYISQFDVLFFFFFQAEDGIRDKLVTGVQTCALPISLHRPCHAPYEGLAPAEGIRKQDIPYQKASTRRRGGAEDLITLRIETSFRTRSAANLRVSALISWSSSRLEAGGQREEGLDLVVRLPQPRGERAHEGPEQLVRQVLVQEHQLLEVCLLDDEQRTGEVRGGVGRARRVVDQRHLPEVAAGLQDGERLLPHSRHHLGDAHLSGGDDVHLGPDFTFLEDALVRLELLLRRDGTHLLQVVRGQIREERDLLELCGVQGVPRGHSSKCAPAEAISPLCCARTEDGAAASNGVQG